MPLRLDLPFVCHIYNGSASLKLDSETGFERAHAQSGQGSGCSHLGASRFCCVPASLIA